MRRLIPVIFVHYPQQLVVAEQASEVTVTINPQKPASSLFTEGAGEITTGLGVKRPVRDTVK